MKWLFDTNVVSEQVRKTPSAKVIDWIAARPTGDAAISIMVLAELRDGALSAPDEGKRRLLTAWIENEVTVLLTLPLTLDILVEWIDLSRRLRLGGLTRDPADMLMAATARVHKLVLVSRNVRHFTGTGVLLYDPWADKSHQMDLA